jgi:hypothetical protein
MWYRAPRIGTEIAAECSKLARAWGARNETFERVHPSCRGCQQSFSAVFAVACGARTLRPRATRLPAGRSLPPMPVGTTHTRTDPSVLVLSLKSWPLAAYLSYWFTLAAFGLTVERSWQRRALSLGGLLSGGLTVARSHVLAVGRNKTLKQSFAALTFFRVSLPLNERRVPRGC